MKKSKRKRKSKNANPISARTRRTELRASIKCFSSDHCRELWEECNQAVKRLRYRHPIWPPRRLFRHVMHNRKDLVEKASEMAIAYGKAKDILLEQIQHWTERTRPEDGHIAFCLYRFGRKMPLKTSAKLSGLEPKVAQALSNYLKSPRLSMRKAAKQAKVSRNTLRRHLERLQSAIANSNCHCGSPHCSLNIPEHRAVLASLVIRIGDIGTGDRKGNPRILLASLAKVARKVARRDLGKRLGARMEGVVGLMGGNLYGKNEYPIVVLPDGMPMYKHRFVWCLMFGRIPDEHVIHHIDCNPDNNHPDNLMMIPKWLHDLLHIALQGA